MQKRVSIPVIASGGAGKPEHLLEVLTEGKADAALVASMVHYGDYTVSGLKSWLQDQGVKGANEVLMSEIEQKLIDLEERLAFQGQHQQTGRGHGKSATACSTARQLQLIG